MPCDGGDVPLHQVFTNCNIHGVRSYDVIIRELAFHLMIKRGLKDSDENRTILNEEMQARINTWLK